MLGLCSKKTARQSRILVVDNNPDSGPSIQRFLQACAWDIVCTPHDQEAVEKAIQEKPTLILLDPVSQSVHNYDTLRFIKQNPTLKDVPVVMCTGSSDAGHRAGEAGALMIVKANTKSCHVISQRLLRTLLGLVEQQDCILL